MLHKNSFKPKDARILSYYADDEVDDELCKLDDLNLTYGGAAIRKKKTTGTQALAEFLSTTSPEEFQRNAQSGSSTPITPRPTSAEPSSTSFFNLRKSKRAFNRLGNNNLINPSKNIFSSIQNTPQNYNRKSHVEIITKTTTPSTVATSSSPVMTTTATGPVLPQMGYNKKRDSSLYSGSLRHSASIRSQLSHMTVATNGRMVGRHLIRQDTVSTIDSSGHVAPNHRNPHQMTFTGGLVAESIKEQQDMKTTTDEQQKVLTQALLSTTATMDVIEAGLMQRLERSKLAGLEKPSDKVAQTLGNEHVRALEVSFKQEFNKTKPKARHAQVQTMDTSTPTITIPSALPPSLSSLSILSSPISGSQFPSPVSDSSTDMTANDDTIERLKQELEEERKHRQRLQVSLDDTKDHFEVLAGLAYKKLREIWEEKQRWENACMELNQQIMMTQHQEHSLGHLHSTTDDHEDINTVLDNVSVLS
ncbi:hypothetical protein BC941DRAFT_415702 [Chlamydoabsidia padenii]|nr:hypothetical protein BC941DRAFT_415702 [Chlamydoabsidia padenii]